MLRWVNKVSVVTGAGAGIGAAISKRLAEEGLQVIGLEKRQERVKEFSKLCQENGRLHGIQCDVSKKDEVSQAFQWIKKKFGPVQILVNNAGVLKKGKLIDGNPDDWKTILDTSVMGLAMCSREAFLQMKEFGLEGHIIHINSISGHEKISGSDPLWFNMHSPAQNAVTCITEIMRKEITHGKYPVKVTSISPGAVSTELINGASIMLESVYGKVPMLLPEDVSDAVCYVISTPPNVNIQELTLRALGEGNYV